MYDDQEGINNNYLKNLSGSLEILTNLIYKIHHIYLLLLPSEKEASNKLIKELLSNKNYQEISNLIDKELEVLEKFIIENNDNNFDNKWNIKTNKNEDNLNYYKYKTQIRDKKDINEYSKKYATQVKDKRNDEFRNPKPKQIYIENKILEDENPKKYKTQILGHNKEELEYKEKCQTQIKKGLPYSCIPRIEKSYPDISYDKYKEK